MLGSPQQPDADGGMRVRWRSPAGSSPGRDSIPRIPCVEEVGGSRNEAAREKGHAMAQYLISFPSDAMDQIPEEEMLDVAKAAHAVCQEAINAGVYVLACGLEDQSASSVAIDGTVTEGPKPDVIMSRIPDPRPGVAARTPVPVPLPTLVRCRSARSSR
jgi:hypothetical protein